MSDQTLTALLYTTEVVTPHFMLTVNAKKLFNTFNTSIYFVVFGAFILFMIKIMQVVISYGFFIYKQRI